MIKRDFFQHTNPDGEDPHERVARLHRRLIGGVGENLYGQQGIQKTGKALAAQMVEKWMDSPTHRENLLRPGFTHLGVCVFRERNSILATQLFSKVSAYLSEPLPDSVPQGDTIPVSIEETFPPDASVVRYDFWDPRVQDTVHGPYVLNDSVRVPDTTGVFRSRFQILDTGEYTAQPGPTVTVTLPSKDENS